MEEVLAHLNGDFDIRDEGVNSNVEWLDDEELEPQLVLPAGSIVMPDGEEEINLRTVQIEERRGGKREPEQCKCKSEFSWSNDRTKTDITGFSKAAGPIIT